jgi:hypothetical protein
MSSDGGGRVGFPEDKMSDRGGGLEWGEWGARRTSDRESSPIYLGNRRIHSTTVSNVLSMLLWPNPPNTR